MLNIDQLSSLQTVDNPQQGLSSKSHAVSSLSLTRTSDTRARYYSLGHHDMIRLSSSGTRGTSTSAVTSNSTNARRNQQRYKLLTEGQIQVCRVPHAKNILEKIRFSRFLRRWEDHYLHLDQCEITSTTVRIPISVLQQSSFFFIFFIVERRLSRSTDILFSYGRYFHLVKRQSHRF